MMKCTNKVDFGPNNGEETAGGQTYGFYKVFFFFRFFWHGIHRYGRHRIFFLLA